MKKIVKIFILLLLIFQLTSCNYLDFAEINKTTSPKLELAPINGAWTIKEVKGNKGRSSYSAGDKFYFDISLFATNEKIYLNPEYEVMRVDLDKYLVDRNIQNLSESIFIDKKINVIEVLKDDLIICEVIPKNRDNMLINIDNELVEIVRESNRLSQKDIEDIKLAYSENERVYKSGENWAITLGIRSLNPNSTISRLNYSTIILSNENGKIKADNVNGILQKNIDKVDLYNVQRKESDGVIKDQVILNGLELPINNRMDNTGANLFRLIFLSDKYASIEYFDDNGGLNRLATYSTNNNSSLNQLRIDNIADYSYDKVLDVIRSSNTDTSFTDSIYNIAIGRENGLTVLKGRVPSFANGEYFNRDYVISSRFSHIDNRNGTVNLDALRPSFPSLVDALPTPSNDHIVIVFKNSLVLYKTDKNYRNFEKVFEKRFDNAFYLVSMNWFEEYELRLLENNGLISRLK